MEAAEAGIKSLLLSLKFCGDVIRVSDFVKKNCTLVGPNCPGVITPEEVKVGMPGLFKEVLGIVSKSGTTYEAADQVIREGLRITTAGIGGPIIGTTTRDAVELFMNDPTKP